MPYRPFIRVNVVRLSVGQENAERGVRKLTSEAGRDVADCGTDSSVAVRFQGRDSLAHERRSSVPRMFHCLDLRRAPRLPRQNARISERIAEGMRGPHRRRAGRPSPRRRCGGSRNPAVGRRADIHQQRHSQLAPCRAGGQIEAAVHRHAGTQVGGRSHIVQRRRVRCPRSAGRMRMRPRSKPFEARLRTPSDEPAHVAPGTRSPTPHRRAARRGPERLRQARDRSCGW